MLTLNAQSQSPMRYAAANIEYAGNVPNEDEVNFPVKVYSVDIKAARHGGEVTLFEHVLFIEHEHEEGMCASIYGIENESGLPDGLRKEFALKQKEIIEFLRAETARKIEVLGPVVQIFEGWQYSEEQWATVAYIGARSMPLNAAIGYLDLQTKKYDRIAILADDLEGDLEFASGVDFNSFDAWAASGKG